MTRILSLRKDDARDKKTSEGNTKIVVSQSYIEKIEKKRKKITNKVPKKNFFVFFLF